MSAQESDTAIKFDSGIAATNANVNDTHSTPASDDPANSNKLNKPLENNFNKLENLENDQSSALEFSYFDLYLFASPLDKFLLCIGALFAVGSGAMQPIMTIIFGNVVNVFVEYTQSSISSADFRSQVNTYCLYFFILGLVAFVFGYFMMVIWVSLGEKQARKFREAALRSIIRQEFSWIDSQKSGDLATRLSGDTAMIQDGLSDKVPLSIQFGTMFIAGFIIAFIRNWKLALVLSGAFPILAIAGAIVGKMMMRGTNSAQSAYAAAGAVAEEVLASIRTVVAFSGQKRETERYSALLVKAKSMEERKSFIFGAGMGVVYFIIFSTYALGFWYGSTLIASNQLKAGDVLNVFFAIIIGAFSLGNFSNNLSSLFTARGAAQKLLSIIHRNPVIDASVGDEVEILKGKIEFQNVQFSYPMRSEVSVLNNLSLVIPGGKTIALVGASGCGKSTMFQLIERFYDPSNGQVFIDGIDVRTLKASHIRQQIGFVSQEPTLFDMSIADNVALGKPGSTREEIIEACKKANAHGFICNLPNGYDTLIGEKGLSISGGQKQRIAIARALIKNPQILLLDEATSALDSESEKLVQHAIDQASVGRTTVMIAHRLSTICNADLIVVVEDGRVLDQGTHDELLARPGRYKDFVDAQNLKHQMQPDAIKEESIALTVDSAELEKAKFKADAPIQLDDLSKKRLHDGDDAITDKDGTYQEDDDTRTVDDAVISGSQVSLAKRAMEKYPITRALRLNKPELHLMIPGALFACVSGSIMPLFSIIFSSVLTALSNPDLVQMRSDANLYSLLFVMLGIISCVSFFCQFSFFGLSGERLTMRLRIQTFSAMLRQEIGWHDRTSNSSGTLAAKLATEVVDIKGLTGQLLGIIIQMSFNICVAMAIAFAYSWKLTLVVLASVPFMAIAGTFQMSAFKGFGEKAKKTYERSAKIASETIECVRTVVGLSREDYFCEKYHDALDAPYKLGLRRAFITTFGYGLSQSFIFFVYSLAYWYGSILFSNSDIDFLQFNRVTFALMFAAMTFGQLSAFIPNVGKASIAAKDVFHLLDRKPLIDSDGENGVVFQAPFVQGKVEFEKVEFQYPTRKNVSVLNSLSFLAEPGKTVAFVGSSGSGKSTILGLVLRYYDAIQGAAKVEDTDVKDWNILALRELIGLVGQEPVLFGRSIKENVRYGKNDCTDEEVYDACKQANIHNFVSELPEGYLTDVGERGVQLSGGQKQRIAIARALIRKPRILLLDEATSALDSTSEKVVQQALDQAKVGRTTLVVAHRLSTIQDADLICVLSSGHIVERGTHDELLAIGDSGLYYQLVKKQTLDMAMRE